METIKHNTFEKWPLEDNSIQAVITSPPYWGLRQYEIDDIIIGGDVNCDHQWEKHFTPPKGGKAHPDRPPNCGANKEADKMDIRGVGTNSYFCKCGAWKGQYGLEPDFKLYIEHTINWLKEAKRVLKKDGLIFLNIGDTYSGMKVGNTNNQQKDGVNTDTFIKPSQSIQNKSKILIPHRVAIAAQDELELICRNDIIWQKPNAMPESCQDRFSKKFENIFMFSKSTKYYFDLDAIKIKWDEGSVARAYRGNNSNKYSGENYGGLQPKNSMSAERDNKTAEYNKLSEEEKERFKNPGDVWNIATQPSPFAHYAMWPEKLVERMVRCSTKPSDIVMDPFMGSGTTLAVAERLGRDSIGFDIGYEDIRKKRLGNIQKELI